MRICRRNQPSLKSTGVQTTPDDFCKIFAQDMDSLYLLSFLLTADHRIAEQCFASGLEDCVEGNAVFKEWARAWSRRAIIKNAIRVVSPLSHATDADRLGCSAAGRESDLRPGLAVITQLKPLERFAYVMSVLERYSDHECASLLGVTKDSVSEARTRAIQRVSGWQLTSTFRDIGNCVQRIKSAVELDSQIASS